ncbi:MAG TPA: prepilin-type N-terminal cleavage/methylation domain-containing protein [Elusimicrobiota bacterium]|nr:prepilin-type N-terminal cleavage/methylation domain-containing protein [Elusimicrobiota bacterium]
MSRASRGFSLVELMTAMAIFGLVATALGSFQQTVAQGETSMLGRTALGNNATLLGQTFRSAMDQATVIVQPASGTGGAALLVGINVDPADGVSAMLPPPAGPSPTYAYLCVDSSQALELYQGPWPMPTIACGEDAARATRTLVAGGGALTVAPLFTRIDGNTVQASYVVSLKPANAPPLSASYNAQASIRGALAAL